MGLSDSEKKSLKILFVVHGYKPAYRIGGPIISVSSLAETLVRKGHQVVVFTTTCNLTEDLAVPVNRPQMVDGVEVWYFSRFEILQKILPFFSYLSKSMGYLYAPGMARQLKKILSSVDIVHTHLPFIYPTYIAAKYARLYGVPLFYHQRGVFDPERLKFRSFKKRLYLKFFEQKNLRSATTLVALTQAEVENYGALCSTATIKIVPNGVGVEQYRTCPLNTDILGVDPEATMILFLGRLHPIKGADKLIASFMKISQKFSQAVLVMAGPDEFMMQKDFQDEVMRRNLEKRIFFTGMLEGDIKKDVLARADLFCLPSDAEGFSMAVLEALASGTAVMLSPGCHFSEVEQAGVGKEVEADPEMMAQELEQLLQDQDRLRAMGAKGREFVVKNYSWDMVGEKMLEIYQEGILRHSLIK